MRNSRTQGFTLIETVIYIWLFSMLMTGVMMTAWQLVGGNAALERKVIIVEEGNFILRKFSWAMAGARTISFPYANGLSVVRHDGLQVDFCLDGGEANIRVGGVGVIPACVDPEFTPLTTPNVVVSTFQFSDLPGNPRGVVLMTRISGIQFEMRKYVRE